MYMLNNTDGSVLDIVGDEEVIQDAAMVSTHTRTSQHWYMYPLHIYSKAEETYAIRSRKSQKALLWDGHRLTVKPFDQYDETQNWTLDEELFIAPKKNTTSWILRVKAFQVVRLYTSEVSNNRAIAKGRY